MIRTAAIIIALCAFVGSSSMPVGAWTHGNVSVSEAWILDTNIWNDSGIWKDASVWQD